MSHSGRSRCVGLNEKLVVAECEEGRKREANHLLWHYHSMLTHPQSESWTIHDCSFIWQSFLIG